MSKKVVSVSFVNEAVEFLEAEMTQSGFFTFSPSIATTNESLQAACKRADEIYVSSLLPDTHYGWEVFPNVEGRYLGSLISNSIQRKSRSAALSTRFQPVKDVVKDGTVSSLVAFQAIEKEKIDSLLNRVNRFKNKVKSVHTLPFSLAKAVVESEKPSANFLLLWVKGDVSVISINSSEGLVKIARTLSYGLPEESLPDVSNAALANFSRDIGREIVMTVNYFKQKFREEPPADLYVLGDDRLQQVIEKHPFENVEAEPCFSLAGKMPEGMTREKFNQHINLMGSLYADDTFNFLPHGEIDTRKAHNFLKISLVALVVLIGLTLLWSVKLPERISNHALTNEVSELQSDVQSLQASINKLQPVKGQKQFYESAFLNEKPPFILILRQLSAMMPKQMVFNSFKMTPVNGYWDCTITGKIKGRDWQERLDILRQFGRSLFSFANVDIKNVVHSLGQAGMDSSTIDFQITMQFVTGEDK